MKNASATFLAATILLASPLAAQPNGEPSMNAQQVPSYLVDRDLPQDVIELVRQGELTKAQERITQLLASAPSNSEQETLLVEQERLRRLQRDFRVTPEELREKLSESIPEVTLDQIERWREMGDLQHMMVDGELRYFRREPVNLFRFSEEARELRDATQKAREKSAPEQDPAAKASEEFTVEGHIAELLKIAREQGHGIIHPVKLRVRHTITVSPDKVPGGETLRCWLPYPRDYRQQQGGTNLITQPAAHSVSEMAPQRTIYMEQKAVAGQPTVFAAEYEYQSAAYVPRISEDDINSARVNEEVAAQYLSPQPPHVMLSPQTRALAMQIVGDEQNPYRKAEKIFHWMSKNFRYASEMEYSVMPCIEEKALTEGKGDCGVFVLTFVSLCRSAGVPARWQSGWVTRPNYWNMHDWAEFHVEPFGWLPADPSMGLRKSDDPAVHTFYFGHIDAYRMIANLDHTVDFVPAKEHWRSDPVDNQRGEVEWDGGNLYYDDFKYSVEILDSKRMD
jgi:transglutaminase-like putative cysteine protease